MRLIITILFLSSLSVSYAQDWAYGYEKTIKNTKGTIEILEDGETVVIIPADNANMRYISPQLPDEYKKKGLKVVFTADVGKIPPHIRMLGHPIRLRCIAISKADQQKYNLKRRKYTFKYSKE